MKVPEKLKERVRTVWTGLCFLVGGLLLVDFLVCLIGAFAALNWLLNQAAVPAFTAGSMLLGIFLYLPARRVGAGKLPRRVLGFGLLGGGLVLIFYVVM